jgi:PIN domain nuclease of toxin-antitoxin system
VYRGPSSSVVNLFDSSALLCFLQGETGADAVEAAFDDGGRCSAANWSEVAQKVLARDGDWDSSAVCSRAMGSSSSP